VGASGASGRWMIAIFVLVGVVLVVVLRQSAEFQDSNGPPHAVTQIVLHARYRDGDSASSFDVDRLWLACAGVPGQRTSKAIGPGTIDATVAPALGRDAQRRLVGCLEDLTLPGMIGDVRSAQAVPLGKVRGPHPPGKAVTSSALG
jgi:hypothetical protein